MYSAKFLLSPGNLSYFEEWYEKSNLNEYWIAKYDNSSLSTEEKYEKAKSLAQVSKQFLDESRKYLENIARSKKMRQYMAGISAIVIILVLSGFTYWALQEEKNAQKQTQIALEETQKTKEAKKKAELEQKKAEQNAILANLARNQSDSARNIAESMRLLADEKSSLALSESEKAKKEKLRADEQLVESQKQRSIAENQRKLAESATESAKRLSNLATAQALTFKAVQKYDDPQINLLLAYFSHKLNTDNNGNPDDQSVFQALNSVLFDYVNSPISIENTGKISDISIKSNTIETINLSGKLNNYSIESLKVNKQNSVQTKTPINKAFLLPKHILFSCENLETFLYNKQTNVLEKLNGYTDFVRACIYLEKSNLLITGARDNKIRIHKIKDNSLQEIVCSSKIVEIAENNTGNIFVVLANGQILILNTTTLVVKEIANLNSSINCMQISPDSEKMIVGTTNGKIKIVNLNSDYNVSNLNISDALIESIAVNYSSNLLAVSSANKQIRIYQLNSLNSKPLVISKHNQISKHLIFTPDGTLLACDTDGKIRKWILDNALQAEIISKKISRNLSLDEWKKFVGNEVEYQILKK